MPTYGKDYFQCGIMFESSPENLISQGIELIEYLGTPIKSGFTPSHTWMVIDENTGVEASTEGVATFPLTKYFNDPSCKIVSCRLMGITSDTISQMLALADKLAKEGLGYDYVGLIGDALEALVQLDNLIPELRKIADPLHDSHHLFCSALVSTLISSTPQYANERLFKTYTISKISPLLLYTGLPYDFGLLIKVAT